MRTNSEADLPILDFRALINAIPEPCLVLLPNDATYTIVAVNRAYAAAMPLTPEEMAGRDLFEFFPNSDELRASLKRAVDGKSADIMPARKYTVNRAGNNPTHPQQERNWSITNSPVVDSSGQVVYVLHRLESAAKPASEKETMYRGVFDAIDDGFCILEKVDNGPDGPLDFRYVDVNRTFAAESGAARVVGKTIREVFPGEPEECFKTYDALIQSGRPVSFERGLVAQGKVLELYAFRIEDGCNRIAVLFKDITDRKRAEQQLLDQWRTFDTALSNTPDFTYTFDLDGRFTYVNRALLNLWQKSLSEAVGKNFFDLGYPTELAERLQRQIRDVIQTRQVVRDQTAFTGPTGETRYYEYIFVPVIGADSQVEATAGSTRDITERLRSEERERESQQQLRESARLESLGIMAGGIAHDFNNLLVGILGNASLLEETVSEKEREMAADIVLAAERAADLTKQMLAYSGRGRFLVEILDLNKLILENLTLLRSSISRSAQIDLNLTSEECFIEADLAQIQQIIMNLLINASEALEGSAGLISIRTVRIERAASRFCEHLHTQVPPGSYISFEIADNGSGMTAETMKRIFDPFFTTKFTGRGLGLAAVLGIVRGHGGDVEVASQLGKGTTFTILLPCSAAADSPGVAADSRIATDAGGVSVLVIDDEEIVRRTAAAGLESRGYRVLLAESGPAGLDLLNANRNISLVILDLTMPVMTGDQVLPLIKERIANIPVILSSGYDEAEVAQRFRNLQIADFLQKPYSVNSLISKVKKTLEASHQPQAD